MQKSILDKSGNSLALAHNRSHAITGTSDHTSTATAGQMLKADANGLPVDGSNTDTEVASAVTLKHTQGTDTALGVLGTKNPPIDADKVIYRDSTASDALVTSTWTQVKAFLKTYFDTLYDDIIINRNIQETTANYSLAAGYNGVVLGPFTIGNGFTFTIADSSRFMVLDG